MANLLEEERLIGDQVGHGTLQSPGVFVFDGLFPMLQAGFAAGEKLVTPLGELRRGDSVPATDGLQRLAFEQTR